MNFLASFAKFLPVMGKVAQQLKPLWYALGAFLVYRVFKNPIKEALAGIGVIRSDVEKEVSRRQQVEQTIESNGLNNISYDQIKGDAVELGEAYGIGTGWFGWNSMTEDEVRALAVINRYTAVTFPLLAMEYNQRYSRDLQADSIRYLTTNQYGSVRHIIQPYS